MSYDAIIIGGGPGGSTAGSVLAQAGKKVLILERERFPRFHVGESLIPYGNDVLREIGAWDKMVAHGFMEKLGAEFVLGSSRAGINIIFGRYLQDRYAQTFQVERAKFDNLLLENSASLGCEVWQETKVKDAKVTDDGVTVTCEKDGVVHEVSARWVLDASGRDAFLGRKMNLPKTDLGLPKKFATFAHFRGVKRNDAPYHGHITIVRLDFGWFWMIPLDAEKTSIGLVQTLEHFKATGMSPGECFEHVVATSTELQKRMAGAERVNEYNFAGDYTYRHLQNAGPRWLLIGDAAGFIDPIFSSGVMLAIRSGHAAAKEIVAADAKGTALTPRAQKRYTKRVGEMCEVFLNMIRMFYDNDSFEVFMDEHPPKGMEWAVNNLVAGNTRMGWRLRLHVWAFYAVCTIHRRKTIVKKIDFSDPLAVPLAKAPEKTDAKTPTLVS
ncbi:tryptophan 7-halogenase [Luteolibacter flavescens]|uniref:Tryptophan 7-halogenase n=1 Tax=Luteolibacter flavescens TaxID=1859460 RepID=A0ABT3FKN1_9BACT|nr:NAD(P)/FAD-dependent oxidoreductase [Luteolibacter flavescens]MCW1883555.1 tryptophan 7-halogenase [Luteolibacter flavescens]